MNQRSMLPGLCGLAALALTTSVHAVTYTWDGSSGNWSDSSNWSPAGVPNGSGSDVIVNSGTTNLASSRTIGELDLDDGEITTSAGRTLTLQDRLDWTGTGKFSGDITVQANGGVVIGSGGTKTLGESNGGAATLINGGTVTQSGGSIYVGGQFGGSLPGSEIINNGNWSITGNVGLFGSVSGNRKGTFTNNNVLTKSGGTGTSNIGITLDNNGTVTVSSGRLLLGAGNDNNASYSATGNGELVFGGARDFGPGDSITGNGTVTFSSGTASEINGANYNVTGTTLVTGAVEFISNESISTLHLDSASADILGDGDLAIGTLIWENGTLKTDSEITVTGPIDMTSGNFARTLGEVSTTILIAVGNTTHTVGDLRINKRGSQFINQGTYTLENSTDIDDGTSGGGVAGRFINDGTVHRSDSGTSRIDVPFDNDELVEVTRGKLEFNGGGNDERGFYTVTGTGEIDFGGGTRVLDSLSRITGDGDVRFSNGTTTLDGSTYEITGSGRTIISGGTVNFDTDLAAEAESITMTGGTRAGQSLLFANRALTWSGGTLASGGTTSANGVNLSGANTKTLGTGGGSGGAVLTNRGTGTMSGGGDLSIAGSTTATFGSQFYNLGTFEITDGSSIVGVSNGGADGTILNDPTGTFTKSGAATTSTIGVAFTNQGTVNANSGTLAFNSGYTQTSGSLVLAGGTVSTTTDLDILGGSLTGSGDISGNADVSNATVAPGASAGLLTISGDLSLAGNTTLTLEIAGLTRGTEYDAFDVGGTLTLAGSLNVTLIGTYIPQAGDSFSLWTAGTSTGSFSSTNLPALSGGLTWDTSQLESSGVLSISGGGGAQTYNDFATTFGLVEGPGGDDDKDGLSNFLEYLWDSIPTDPSSAPSLTITRSGTTTTISLTVPENLAPGVSQFVESSPTLTTGPWDPVAIRPAGGTWQAPAATAPPMDGFIEVTIDVVEGITENFYRFGGAEE